MAVLDTTKVTLPTSVTTTVLNNLHDASVIASLCPADALAGLHNDAFNVFTSGTKAEVVGEGAQKSPTDPGVTIVNGKTFKVQTTTRVSSELSWADEDDQLGIIAAIQQDQTAAIAEALDAVIIHSVNPLAGTKLSGFKGVTTGAASVTATGKAVDDIDSLADAVNDFDINGIALSRPFASDLRKARADSGVRLFPEIPLSLQPGTLDGVPAVTSRNVGGKNFATTDPKVLAIMGDWSTVRWRIARNLEATVIPFGDPDGAGDLQRNNQVAFRTEAVFSFAILDPKRLAVLKPAAQ